MKITKVLNLNKWTFFILLLLTSPVIFWQIYSFNNALSQFQKTPSFIQTHLSHLFPKDQQLQLTEFKFEDNKRNLPWQGRLFYNKFSLLIEQAVDSLSLLSPRAYFYRLDNDQFSPPTVEPIAIILIPLWLFGIITLIKQKKWQLATLLLFFILIEFFIGVASLLFLLPVVIIYLYIIAQGFGQLKSPPLKLAIFSITLIYNLFLIGRLLWV